MNSELLEEAAEWSIVSLLFMPPKEGWGEEIVAIASEVKDPELKSAAVAASREANESLYYTLFGPGGMVKLRAVSHIGITMPGEMLAQLKGLYEAFEYRPSVKEPPDHLAVMTGFVAYLTLKQATGGGERMRRIGEVLAIFVKEYLEPLAYSVSRELSTCGVNYLTHVSYALLHRIGKTKGRALSR